eukprot:TRINITY_DN21386_c0_g1_i1.p1 TRINITY_DN21386_c0_g1~~TRINITY_DN21386_c0_g1_i1.p1  ORF type:complete len:732 (-),score=296.38 TRINITY_DN21386_c0_g1_i1:910-3105(-)
MAKLWKVAQFVIGLSLGYLIPCLYGPSLPDPPPSVSLPTHTSANMAKPLLPLFVGVMTARKYLSTRACSVWRAWGKEVIEQGGDIRFFVGEGDTVEAAPGEWCGVPLVVLDGVEDGAYPPQEKSFMMLAWMWDNFGSKARWFLRADDDVFVKVEQLVEFLRPINDSEPQYIGQAGRGRGLEEGKLDLDWNQNFCMGGPGVVLSWTTLSLMREQIPSCLASLVTSHEDVEVGRCVARSTGRACTWAYDMQTLFYHSSGGKDDKGSEVVPAKVGERVLQHALTIHPLKQPENMENMAVKVASSKRTEVRTRALKARVMAAKLAKDLPAGSVPEVEMLDGDLLDNLSVLKGPWDLILNHQLYSVKAGGARRKVPQHLAEGLTRVVGHVLDVINAEASEKGRIIEFRDLFYAYVHTDPKYGLTYILDLLLLYKRYKGNKMTVKVRRHVYVRQPFLPLVAMLEEEEEQESNPPSVPVLSGDGGLGVAQDTRQSVTIIVPVAGEKKIPVVRRFLENYEKEVLSQLQPARLVMVVFKEEEGDTQMEAAVREGTEALESNYPGYDFTVTVLSMSFNRGVGMMAGIKLCVKSELLLLIDVDIQFSGEALDLVRSFSKPGEQVYFPIVFSMFKGEKEGYWRDFGFGIMSAYKQDIEMVQGFNTTITGWGKEDVDLYERFLTTNISIFRAPTPHLVHRYHPVTCSPSLPTTQAAMCKSSKASNYLPLGELVDKILNSSLLNG